MKEAKILRFADLRKKITEHLTKELGTKNFTIVTAKHSGNAWNVNIEFDETINRMPYTTPALINLDDKTGAVIEFRKGNLGRF